MDLQYGKMRGIPVFNAHSPIRSVAGLALGEILLCAV